MNCAKCGNPLSEGWEFCRYCGTPVPTPTPPAPVLGPPPLPDRPAVPFPASPASPPPLPGTPPPSPLAPPGQTAAPSTSGSKAGLIAIVSIASILMLSLLGIGGYLVAKQVGWLGGPAGVTVGVTTPTDEGPSGGGSAVAPSDTASVESSATSETPPAAASVTLAGTVIDLKDAPTDPTLAGVRIELLNAARANLSTTSKFFVNQLWVDGDVAVGDIGAEHGGHRMCVVWRGNPWHVVWSGDWGTTDESSLTINVRGIPSELLGKIEWTKAWPKKFKFLP